MGTKDSTNNSNQWTRVTKPKQSTDARPPAINIMVETWVHMVQGGRVRSGWTALQDKG